MVIIVLFFFKDGNPSLVMTPYVNAVTHNV